MTADQKQLIQMQFDLLRQTMKKEGLVFKVLTNREDADKFSLAIIDRDSLARGENVGIVIGLEELNRGLV